MSMRENKTTRRAARLAFLGIAWVAAMPAQAYTTSFGAENLFVSPSGWNTGDANATYNEWDAYTVIIGNAPDIGAVSNPAGLSGAALSTQSPGFVAEPGLFYSFSGNYGIVAEVYNHGGVSGGGGFAAADGTHIIVQTGGTQSRTPGSAPELVPGHGVSNLWQTLQIVDHAGNTIVGGDNASALQIREVSYRTGLASNFGPVNYQDVLYEFWLPGYSGDFRVDFDQIQHATLDTIRVDSTIAPQATGGGTPFALLLAEGIAGDFNASGQVEQGDLDLVLQNWGDDTTATGVPASWTNDNINLGQIEQTELDRVLQNWGSTSAPDFSGHNFRGVPEPASLMLLVLGGSAVFGRRR